MPYRMVGRVCVCVCSFLSEETTKVFETLLRNRCESELNSYEFRLNQCIDNSYGGQRLFFKTVIYLKIWILGNKNVLGTHIGNW